MPNWSMPLTTIKHHSPDQNSSTGQTNRQGLLDLEPNEELRTGILDIQWNEGKNVTRLEHAFPNAGLDAICQYQ